MPDPARVLLVDDETNVLAGLKRQLRKDFSISVALSGQEALGIIKAEATFEVIVVDMRMPEMNGIELLEQVMRITPDTTRIMLTGNAEQQTAIDAVNEGHVFRFFTKPISMNDLSSGIHAGVAQYRLVTAERELLEKTLAGSVKVLVDVLSMSNPSAFQKAQRIRNWGRKILKHMEIRDTWEVDMGMMMAPLGMVTLHHTTLAKDEAGDPLSDEDRKAIRQVPEFGYRLLKNIPRMGPVANVVLYQSKNYDGSGFPNDHVSGENIPFGARLLHILGAIHDLSPTTMPSAADVAALRLDMEKYDVDLLRGVADYFAGLPQEDEATAGTYMDLKIGALMEGDTLVSDLLGHTGLLYLAKGSVLTIPMIESIRLLRKSDEISETIRIFRPPHTANKTEEEAET